MIDRNDFFYWAYSLQTNDLPIITYACTKSGSRLTYQSNMKTFVSYSICLTKRSHIFIIGLLGCCMLVQQIRITAIQQCVMHKTYKSSINNEQQNPLRLYNITYSIHWNRLIVERLVSKVLLFPDFPAGL